MMRSDDAPKRATNLSLNAKALDAEVRKRYWERWNDENKEAIAKYNERIEREGLPLARHRTFMRQR